MVAHVGLLPATHGSWTSKNVTTGIQNFLICVEMWVASVAHQRAFPVTDWSSPPPSDDDTKRELTTSLLSDHLAFHDAVRDFNEVMPIVFPIQYTPGPATIVTHMGAANSPAVEPRGEVKDTCQSLENDYIDPYAHKKHGWRL